MKNTMLFLLFCFFFQMNQAQEKRPYLPNDLLRTIDISAPQFSPDGQWVCFVKSTIDSVKDVSIDDIWMVNWEGNETLQITKTKESEYAPCFSPDNKYLSFLSSRYSEKEDEENTQVWIMDRRGGEAQRLTHVSGEIEDYTWSPDGSKILLTIKDEDFADTASTKIRQPFVMNSYLFKKDIEGYIDARKTHLYIFDVPTGRLDTLTSGAYNEAEPAWSPDGKQVVFVSNRSVPDPDRNENTDIWIMNAIAHSPIRQLTNWPGTESSPVFNMDGTNIAYLQSSSSNNFTMYGHDILSVVSVNGGLSTPISALTDRPVLNARWSKDGQSIFALMEDDRQQLIVQFNLKDKKLVRVADGEKVFLNLEINSLNGQLITTMNSPQLPTELYAVENGQTRRLTYFQDAFMDVLKPITVKGFTSTSKDGNKVSGILYLPGDADPTKKLPLILYIHGGPVGQDAFEFDIYRNILAAGGYAVAAINYRGSSGRGVEYITTINADWGNKEVLDIIGAANYLIKEGIADENKMGIGGWSYGGILTDYTIATDQRFKAAASGAGSALQFSMYGTDQYIVQYEAELGVPWKNKEKWMQLSYPFFNADKIKTPTLFMASQKDFNVPAAGAEQMYQALRSQNIPTELIIYPGQYHGITVPSYMKDRFDRYLKWFGKYLK